MLKTTLIILLVLAAVLIGGGSYYYFEIYQPEKYAASALLLYQKLESAGLQPDTSLLAGAADYEKALKILDGRIKMLESIKKDLAAIETPKKMENYQKEFLEYIDFELLQHKNAASSGLFVKAVSDLYKSIQVIYKVDEDRTKINTIGDLQKLWDENVVQIKFASIEMFRKEIKELENPSFPELKTLWDGASPVFDLVLKKIKTFDPKLPLGQIGNAFTPAEQKQLDIYTKNLEKFLKALETLTQKYSAYDLLAFKYFPDATPAEISERSLKFYQSIQKLKERYGK